MSFKTYYQLCSYAMIAVATLSLVWAGALHLVLGAVFCAALVLSWRLEGGTWQLSERTGLILVLLSIPIFYLDWSYQAGPRFITGDESQTQALVGAIAAFWYAPQSGKETRQDIQEKAEDVRDDIEHTAKDVRQRIEGESIEDTLEAAKAEAMPRNLGGRAKCDAQRR